MRTAIIGASHWHAPRQAAAFRAAGCRIVAASDPDPGAAAALGQSDEVAPFRDHQRLLASEEVELAVVLGTPLEMPQYVLDALAAGCAVAVEKPLARDAQSLEPVVSAARGRFVAVALANRYSGLWDEVHAVERAGRAGHRRHASFRLLNGLPERYERDGVPWVLDPRVSGGGALRNLGIHGVDAFLQFSSGDEVSVEDVSLAGGASSLVEEHAVLTLRSRNGLSGTVEAGYTFPTLADGGDYEWRVSTGNTYFLERALPGRNATLEVFTLDEEPRLAPTTPLAGRYDAFARDVVESLKAGRAPRATLEDLHRAMAVIDEAYALAGRASC
ncbi:MAG TPA: Gfo/Idh/MocA family oxidoreductase [Deinococcales bacterium]|nr:Gfo/Idh/MocA family oxidoreductase [Deinococcales bacterium]